MWLPRKLYEALPSLYIVIGAMLFAGTFYVGLDHLLMIGYLVVGALCVTVGVVVKAVRRKARADAEARRSHSEQLLA